MRTRTSVLLVLTGLLSFSADFAPVRDLTFEERVAAQRAIERVYYAHQIGTTQPFEEAVPREVLEKKVRTYLKQSAALEQFWHAPITAEALQRELQRMARNTRFPERLQEVYSALGNDPFLVEECFVRPVLADRFSRSFFESDARIHGPAGSEADQSPGALKERRWDTRSNPLIWDAWWAESASKFAESSVHAVAGSVKD